LASRSCKPTNNWVSLVLTANGKVGDEMREPRGWMDAWNQHKKNQIMEVTFCLLTSRMWKNIFPQWFFLGKQVDFYFLFKIKKKLRS
jgi:hypothetical protein